MVPSTLIGFDSAWTNNPRAPGAICALTVSESGSSAFHPPRLATFEQAEEFISSVRPASGPTLIALDQPTIVPNVTSSRPVERVVASLISWLGGGVQPSNRGRIGMFCDNSPVWKFLTNLGAHESPENARTAKSGLHLMEVFPALALPSLEPTFCTRLGAPKYNPGRKKAFRKEHWRQVAEVTARQFRDLGFLEAASWCDDVAPVAPTKADQDRLDAMLCLLVAAIWRFAPRERSMVVGDLETGYMVFPASEEVRSRIEGRAALLGVPAR